MFNEMYIYLVENGYWTWGNLAVVVIAAAGIFGAVYFKLITKEQLKKAAEILIVEAEYYLGTETGKEKKALVVGWIYSKVPKVLQLFATEKQLNDIVDKAFEAMKKKVVDGHTVPVIDE